MYKILFCIFFCFIFKSAIANPKEVILIRHADKLIQSNGGVTLSAKGEARSINFAFYYLQKFDIPDFIFATNPKNHKSIRQLQTVSPLANLLAEKNSNQEFPILYPYKNSEYEELAEEILSDSKYKGKIILICWDHGHLPDLARELGVKDDIPEWPDDDYDSVYDIKYDDKNTHFTILHHQYPINPDISWEEIYKRIN